MVKQKQEKRRQIGKEKQRKILEKLGKRRHEHDEKQKNFG